MLADCAADKPCANFHWIAKYFKEYIIIDKDPVELSTPNGPITPKYCIYFSFPAWDGRIFKAKFVLLPQLPAPILADINMLIAFGYKFMDEIPPIFRHPSGYDQNLQLKENDKFKIISHNAKFNWDTVNKVLNNSNNIVNNIKQSPLDLLFS